MQRRARKDADKLKRREAILAAAWQAFQATPYDAITMSEIAEKVGLAKGTVYLYFKTKEEMFLAIQEVQLEEWFAEIDTQLQKERAIWSIGEVTALIADSLHRRAALARLLALLPSVLEHNIDFETALRFKRMLLAHITRTGALLEQRLPFLDAGQGGKLILRIHALIVGLQQMADPAPLVRLVLQEPDLRVLAIDFSTEFSETLRTLLGGLESESRKGNE